MAKLVFGMNQSLDGFVDHMAFAPGPTLFRHFIEEAKGQVGSVYGRQMYEIMRYWDDDHPEWNAEEHAFAAAWRKVAGPNLRSVFFIRAGSPMLPFGQTRRSFLAVMPAVTLKAHYDGNRILLDEPYQIPANSPLMVTVLPLGDGPMDADALAMARHALGRAYGDDEPEYSGSDVAK